MISFFKNLFKKKKLSDPKLLEIAKAHRALSILILDVDKNFGISHPFYLQDDIFSSHVGHTKADGKNVKFLPKMFGDKVSVRLVERGDILIFSTLKFGFEGIFWKGEVQSIKPLGKIIIKRLDFRDYVR